MGLTIHYTLETRHSLSLAAVRRLLEPLRDRAALLGFVEVGPWLRLGPDYPGLYYQPPGSSRFSECLPPAAGWLFHATPGDGCESVRIGLCRHAGVPGWRLESFCKTQYASRHGWEHFLHCHLAVVLLLTAAETVGLRVTVEDEGGLWESGSFAVLRRNLAEYDEGVAALGGALKDAAEAADQTIEAPILDHPQFEHLEAQGLAEHGGKVGQAVAAVKHLVR